MADQFVCHLQSFVEMIYCPRLINKTYGKPYFYTYLSRALKDVVSALIDIYIN